jgi:hypothetical protein
MDFSRADHVALWSPLDDVVMGGRSSSRVEHVDGILRFEGRVSLENGGGFASMQADVDFDLRDARALVLDLRGDGKRYKVGLYDERGRGRVAYRAPFEVDQDRWSTVKIRFDELQPRFRGRDVPDAPPLERSHVQGLSILISDKQQGPFELDIRSISVVE